MHLGCGRWRYTEIFPVAALARWTQAKRYKRNRNAGIQSVRARVFILSALPVSGHLMGAEG